MIAILLLKMYVRGWHVKSRWDTSVDAHEGVMVVAETGVMFLVIAFAKILEREESISPCSFYGNCPTVSHTFLVLSTQWMSSPYMK